MCAFFYKDEVGNCTGLDIEVAREAGRRLGIEIICVHTAWEGLIPAVLSGRVDNVPVSMDQTPTKCEVVEFTDPYHTMGIGALVKAGNPKDVHSFEDFLKEDVVVAGSIGAEVAIARGAVRSPRGADPRFR